MRLESFKRKLQESERSCLNFRIDALFVNPQRKSKPSPNDKSTQPPPRLFSDQYVNIYFQEWAPLFPVLHRPAFLASYQAYVSSPEQVDDPVVLAQLNLVFGIAALSSSVRSGFSTGFKLVFVSSVEKCGRVFPILKIEADRGFPNQCRLKCDIESLESQWQRSIDSILMKSDLATLQCLVLAQLYCIAKGDYSKLLHYKGVAIGLSQRLGLHQGQKRFSLDVLALEIRKKTFWTLYTLDWYVTMVEMTICLLTNLVSRRQCWDYHRCLTTTMCMLNFLLMLMMSVSLRKVFSHHYLEKQRKCRVPLLYFVLPDSSLEF